ncbi:MAG: GTPase RsgA, partial [Paracoccaceae bacterium]
MRPDMPFPTLASLGWSAFFADQLSPSDVGLVPVRIAVVHRSRLMAETGAGQIRLDLLGSTMDFAVGDWVMMDPARQMFVRRLTRNTLLRR